MDRTKAFSLAVSPYGGFWPSAPSFWDPSDSNPVQNGSSLTAADTDLSKNLNLPPMSTQPRVFRCPSDHGEPLIPADGSPNSPYTPTYGPGGNFTGAKSSYDFVTYAQAELDGCNSWGSPWANNDTQYMFGQNSYCPIARVTDGMSNTFMLARRFPVHRLCRRRPGPAKEKQMKLDRVAPLGCRSIGAQLKSRRGRLPT